MKSCHGLVCVMLAFLALPIMAQDSEPPSVSFIYPTDQMTLETNWLSIRGEVSDNPGGSGVQRVDLYILAPDETFWNGTQYVNEPTALATVLTGSSWARTNGLPTKLNLQTGTYTLIADGVDMAGNIGSSSISVHMQVPPPPANDDFVGAELLPALEGTVEGTTAGATREDGEPDHAGLGGNASIWYRFTPPEDGWIQMDTVGSTFDTLLGVYTGPNVASLTQVASNNDGGPLGTSAIEASVGGGVTYYAAIDGRFGASGRTILNWRFNAGNRPPLTIERGNAGTVVISWSASATGFRLETVGSLSSGSWGPTGVEPVIEEDRNVVRLPAANGSAFYRLISP